MSVFVPNTAGASLSNAWTAPEGSDITLMCWAMLGTTNPGTYRIFLTAEPNLGLGTNADGLTLNPSTYAGPNYTGQVLVAGNWYHVVETINANGSTTSRTLRGYVNGVICVNAADTTAFTGAYTGSYCGNIDPGDGGGQPLAGNIRDVRIWTRSLTNTEIVAEMRSARPVKTQGLVAWSPFDTDLSTDKSGQGHVWTTNGAGVLQQSGPLKPWPGRSVEFVR